MLMFISCTEVFETNLSKASVNLLVPANNDTVVTNTNTFKWQEVEGADKYHIQIVAPSFDQMSSFLVDSSIDKSSESFTLSPGKYQWRVKATNHGSQSDYSFPRNLFIDTSSILTTKQLIISVPSDQFATNSTNIDFEWNPLNPVEFYRFELRKGTDWNTAQTINNSQVSTNKFTIVDMKEGDYLWEVQAQNNVPSISKSSARFRLSIDTTRPLVPTLTSPQYAASLSDSAVALKWTSSDNSSAPVQTQIFDSVFVGIDSSFVASIYKGKANEDKHVVHLKRNKLYYWWIRSADKAGNVGGHSAARKFTVN